VNFDVTRRRRKTAHDETQTHGVESRRRRRAPTCNVLATVKAFLGFRGVVAEHVTGETRVAWSRTLYALLNDPVVRTSVIEEAARRYGYPIRQIEWRLYIGRFVGAMIGEHEGLPGVVCRDIGRPRGARGRRTHAVPRQPGARGNHGV
jgi:hypothetical protein